MSLVRSAASIERARAARIARPPQTAPNSASARRLAAIADLHSPEYAALHGRSTQVYGGVVLLAFAALVTSAVRGDA